MVSFGDSKHKPVKPLQSLLNVMPLKLALSAKCFIYDVGCWFFYISLSFNYLAFFLIKCHYATTYPRNTNLFCFFVRWQKCLWQNVGRRGGSSSRKLWILLCFERFAGCAYDSLWAKCDSTLKTIFQFKHKHIVVLQIRKQIISFSIKNGG